MRLAVLGSTGGTGKQVVEQALGRGHRVVALARRPEAVTVRHDRLVVRRADVMDPDSLRDALAPLPEGPLDAVVSGLGVVRFAEMFREITLYSAGGRNLVAAMAAQGLKRVVVVTSGGVEAKDPAFGWFYERVMRPVLLARAYADMRRLEAVMQGSGLDWTVVRPTQLTDEALTGQYRVSPRLSPPGGT
ncbi:MAG: NAD(P)H-binding protein, partial [Myxococcota bacterium]